MSQPFFTIDLKEKIDCINLSSFDWSKNLIAIASKSKIIVAILRFQEEFDDLDQEVEYEVIEEFFHSPRVHCFAWSPNSSLDKLPSEIEICAAGSDFSLRIFTSDLTSKKRTRKEIQGHDGVINDCKYDSDGEYLASASDDLTCKLWKNGSHVHTFNLTSPGVSVNWHAEQPGKLMVAEKKGLFRIYNTSSMTPIMSVICSPTPLMSAEWSPRQNNVIFLAAGQLFKADLMVPGHSVESKTVHPEGGYSVSVCPANPNYIATAGRPNNSLKITNIKTKLTVISTNLMLFGGFSWHNRLPVLCVANNSALCIFKISTN